MSRGNKQQFNIQTRFGSLNPIQRPDIQDRINLQDISHLDIVKKSAELTYTPNSILGTGPYKAIVLKIKSNNKEMEPGGWIQRYFQSIVGEDKTNSINLVQIKARIPELHSMLPIPSSLGDNSDEDYILEMYPTFIAMNTDVPVPEVGSLIWVDFVNKNNFKDPIYIAPVVMNKNTINSYGTTSPSIVHKTVCSGESAFDSNMPIGENISFKNKSLSHSGELPKSRILKNNISKEFKFIKGNLFSDEIVDLWKKSVEKNGSPGISWIGVLKNNGELDIKNKKGKRNNIIYVSNRIDYNQNIELIYYFHDNDGFGDKDFENVCKQIKIIDEQNKNFIFIYPELPWSNNGENIEKRRNEAFSNNDKFSSFHNEILETIKNVFSEKYNISNISFACYGIGGFAFRNIIISKSIENISFNRVNFVEINSLDLLNDVWRFYIKNRKEVELNLLVNKNGGDFNVTKNFFKNNAIIENDQRIYVKFFKKTSLQIDEFLYFSNPIKEQKKQELAKNIIEDNQNIDFDSAEENIDSVKNTSTIRENKYFPLGINKDISPSGIQKKSVGNKQLPKGVVLEDAKPGVEARVLLKEFGSLPEGSNLLVPVLSTRGIQYLHKLAYSRFSALQDAWLSENPGQPPIKIASGWRKKRWISQQDYNEYVIRNYGSVEEGRKWLAYDSPHETGLAFDIGNNGLEPRKETMEFQKKTRLYQWLIFNAHRFGITPYLQESWHYEIRLPRESWATGEEFTDNFAVLVVKTGEGGILPKSFGDSSIPRNTNCVSTVG